MQSDFICQRRDVGAVVYVGCNHRGSNAGRLERRQRHNRRPCVEGEMWEFEYEPNSDSIRMGNDSGGCGIRISRSVLRGEETVTSERVTGRHWLTAEKEIARRAVGTETKKKGCREFVGIPEKHSDICAICQGVRFLLFVGIVSRCPPLSEEH